MILFFYCFFFTFYLFPLFCSPHFSFVLSFISHLSSPSNPFGPSHSPLASTLSHPYSRTPTHPSSPLHPSTLLFYLLPLTLTSPRPAPPIRPLPRTLPTPFWLFLHALPQPRSSSFLLLPFTTFSQSLTHLIFHSVYRSLLLTHRFLLINKKKMVSEGMGELVVELITQSYMH